MKLIRFEEFLNDFKNNVIFKGGAHDFSELVSGICVRLPAGDISDEIYLLDKSGEASNYFYYQGERFCMAGSAIVAYQRNSYLNKVQGNICSTKLDAIKESLIMALDSYKEIQKLCQHELVDIDVRYPYEKATGLAEGIYRQCCSLFEYSIKHTLSSGCAYASPEFDSFVKKGVFRHGCDVDWSYNQFTEYFDLSKVMGFLFDDYNPQAIADTYNESHAKTLAWAFHNAAELKSGIRLKETWRYLSSWDNQVDGYLAKAYHKCGSVELLESLKVCFDFCDNKKLNDVMSKVLNSKLAMGDSMQESGVAVRVYKEHYVVTLDKKALGCVLLYANKFAQVDLKDALERAAA